MSKCCAEHPDDWTLQVQIVDREFGTDIVVSESLAPMMLFRLEAMQNWNFPTKLQVVDPSLAAPYTQSSLSLQATFEGSMNTAKHWLNQCLDAHPMCQTRLSRNRSGPFPLRLLHLAYDSVRLETLSSAPSKPYVTLSHRWGAKSNLSLTSETKAELSAGIPRSRLPKTYEDVVSTALSLGISLLWIDSLCIIQDSADDWNSQSAIMGDIYEKALFNIAAGAASDETTGCFPDRKSMRPTFVTPHWQPRWQQNKINVAYHIYDTALHSEDVLSSHLASRGWIAQELFLAPRILYLNYRQLWWECPEMTCCETYPDGLPRDMTTSIPHRASSHSIFDSDSIIPNFKDRTREIWKSFILDYSQRQLAVHTDKLVAISGIAKKFSNVLEDEYLAGMWASTLPSELLWQNLAFLPLTVPDRYVAPSWSWASLLGKCGWEIGKIEEVFITITQLHNSPSSDDPTGCVKDGFLRLSGPLFPVTFDKTKDGTITAVLIDGATISWVGQSAYELCFDTYSHGKNVHYLPVLRDDKSLFVAGLLLEPSGTTKGQFRRLGILRVRYQSVPWSSHDEKRAKDPPAWFEYEEYDGFSGYEISII